MPRMPRGCIRRLRLLSTLPRASVAGRSRCRTAPWPRVETVPAPGSTESPADVEGPVFRSPRELLRSVLRPRPLAAGSHVPRREPPNEIGAWGINRGDDDPDPESSSRGLLVSRIPIQFRHDDVDDGPISESSAGRIQVGRARWLRIRCRSAARRRERGRGSAIPGGCVSAEGRQVPWGRFSQHG